MTTTNVLGLGNVLMGDDGFGPAAVRAFEAEYLVGPDVNIVDVGTPGLDLMPWLADVERVIIVDTVKGHRPPGSMRLYRKADILKHLPPARIGPHDPGVKEALLTLEFAGRAPSEVVLVGVVPETVGMRLGLSPALRGAIPSAVYAVAVALEKFGHEVTVRSRTRTETPWWTPPVAQQASR
ncbi:MAG: HyaD/HybD family hydrogenase maturation endopeptidase [Vicinamibacterales bacterium]